jgi:hypothetical protein
MRGLGRRICSARVNYRQLAQARRVVIRIAQDHPVSQLNRTGIPLFVRAIALVFVVEFAIAASLCGLARRRAVMRIAVWDFAAASVGVRTGISPFAVAMALIFVAELAAAFVYAG